MMRKFLLFVTACVYVAAMVFGIAKKHTYTDLTWQKNYLTQLQVAELPESIAEKECAVMTQKLPDSPIILRVEVIGEIEHLFQADRQRAIIREVYVCDELEEGEEIDIISRHWQLVIYDDEKTMERGFVNIMEVGAEYLIFAETVSENPETGILSVKTCDEFYVTPVFCYDEHPNAVISTSGDSTYVSYQDVMNNEFFAASEKAMLIMKQLKEEMISLYPRDNLF